MEQNLIGSLIDVTQYSSTYAFLRRIAPFMEWYCKEYKVSIGSADYLAVPLIEVHRLAAENLLEQIWTNSAHLAQYLSKADQVYQSLMRGYKKHTPIKDIVLLQQ